MKYDETMQVREQMSALADGQLQGDAFAQAMAHAAQDPEAAATWHCYHLVGDVLRAPDLQIDAAHDSAFLARLRQSLAAEPAPLRTVVTPDLIAEKQINTTATRQFDVKNAANDQLWRWKMVAGVASVAAVGVLAWTVGGSLWSNPQGGPVLAQTPASSQVLVASPNGVVLRDQRLDDMLAAHRQLGATSALQMPAGFLRNATFEGAAR
ncbi:MAG: sigma-E factor negative regulatory protein [Pseudomonadota bacterium]